MSFFVEGSSALWCGNRAGERGSRDRDIQRRGKLLGKGFAFPGDTAFPVARRDEIARKTTLRIDPRNPHAAVDRAVVEEVTTFERIGEDRRAGVALFPPPTVLDRDGSN